MARAVVAVQEPKKPTTTQAANVFDLAMQAANPTDKEYVNCSGGEFLLAQNTHATNPYTFTVNSTRDTAKNRAGDITAFSLGAGEIAIVGPFTRDGWEQSGADAGKIFLEAENAAIKFAWIRPVG